MNRNNMGRVEDTNDAGVVTTGSTAVQQQQQQQQPSPSPPPQNTNSGKNEMNPPTQTPFAHCHKLLDKIFMNCSNDPVGNVHRTWSVTLLMLVVYMIITVFQIIHLHASNHSNNSNAAINNNIDDDNDDANNNSNDASYGMMAVSSSPALLLACLWHGVMQFIMIGFIGTFIMKRFPTSFAIGFLFGMLIVFINQNIIYMITFTHYNKHHGGSTAGSGKTSPLYTVFSLLLAIVLCMFGILLFHFQKYIIVAPIDAKGFSRSSSPTTGIHSTAATSTTTTTKSATPTTTYQRYDDDDDDGLQEA